jgi:hypothetical protein
MTTDTFDDDKRPVSRRSKIETEAMHLVDPGVKRAVPRIISAKLSRTMYRSLLEIEYVHKHTRK